MEKSSATETIRARAIFLSLLTLCSTHFLGILGDQAHSFAVVEFEVPAVYASTQKADRG